MIHSKLQEVFRQVFRNASLEITDATTAKDVAGWDSLTHVRLILAVEKAFQVKFRLTEMAELNCVGDLKALLQRYLPTLAA